CITTSEHYPKGNLPTNSSEEAYFKGSSNGPCLANRVDFAERYDVLGYRILRFQLGCWCWTLGLGEPTL
ncbi:MAG: hypothetical protein O2931_18160, partial [Planctomycetota bacterium]|nr:hypothetical protein [Planctomycetota bacterium]